MTEFAAVVSLISELANTTVTRAWECVEAEFQTQVNVWNSQAVLGASRNYGHVEQLLDEVFQVAKHDHYSANMMLNEIMQSYGMVLNDAVQLAACKAATADQLSVSRAALADRLQAAAGRVLAGALDDSDLAGIIPLLEQADLDRKLDERLNALLFGGQWDRIQSL